MAGRFKVWCPLCDERAYLDEADAANGLADNHDENYHDGETQTFVSRILNSGGDR